MVAPVMIATCNLSGQTSLGKASSMDLLGERQFGVSRQHELSHKCTLPERDIREIGTSFFNIGIEARLRPITSSDMAMTNRLGSEPQIACAHAVKR